MAVPTKEELRRKEQEVELEREKLELLREQQKAGTATAAEVANQAAALKDQRDALRQIREDRRLDSAEIREQITLIQDQITALGGMERGIEKSRLLREAEIEQVQRQIELAREQAAIHPHLAGAMQAAIDAGQERIEQLEEENEALAGAGDLIESQLGSTSRLADKMKEFAMASEAGSGALYLMASAADAATGPFNSIVSSIKSIVMGAHIAEKQFEKTFQLPAEYTTRLRENYKAVNLYGVSAEEASAATGALVTNVTEFTMASAAQQDSLVKTTALMAETGIAAGDVAKGVQNSMKMFGQSIEGAETTALELAAVARELQVVPGEMAAQYAAMGPQLAKFGREGISTFKELSRIQKLTGMEMSKVIQITSKFDTFEGAAEATGKLNAALGGNFVNAMDMMMDTDPASRFETIRGAIEQAGLSFDTMSYYQKQFYTEALGLSDVGDLALMLSGNTDLMTDATQKSAEEYEEQAKRAKAVQNIQEQLQNILAENAEAFLDLANMAAKFLNFLADNMWIIKTATAVFGALKVMQIATAATSGTLAIANLFMEKSMSKTKTKAIQASVGLGAFALALGGIALAMWMASPSQLVIEIVALAGALWLTAKVLSNASPALVKAGGALTVFGAGLWATLTPIALLIASVALLYAGMGVLITAVTGLLDSLTPEKVGLMVKFMLSFGAGAMFIPLAAAGMFLFAASMFALGFSLFFVSKKKLFSIAVILASIAKIPPGGFSQSAKGLKSIASAAKSLPVGKLRALRKLAQAFSSLGAAITSAALPLQGLLANMAALQTDALSGVGIALQHTAEALNEVPVMKTMILTAGFGSMALAGAALGPIARAFAAGGGDARAARGASPGGGAPGAPGAAAGTTNQNITVRLELDGKLLEEKVVRIMGEQYKPIFAGQG